MADISEIQNGPKPLSDLSPDEYSFGDINLFNAILNKPNKQLQKLESQIRIDNKKFPRL